MPEAASRLRVSRSRVHALLASGRLRGRCESRWEVDPDSVDRYAAGTRGRGRPLTARNAWAVLALARPEGGLRVEVGAKERSRLRGLLRAAGGVEGIAPRLRRRAEEWPLRAHPGVLGALLAAGVAGGAAALPNGVGDRPVGGAADLYVPVSAADWLAERYALSREGVANVVLRLVDDDLWPFATNAAVAPPVVGAVDLLDAGDERSVRAARLVLSDAGRP